MEIDVERDHRSVSEVAGPPRHILVVSHTGRRDSIDAALSVCAQLAEADVHLVLTAD